MQKCLDAGKLIRECCENVHCENSSALKTRYNRYILFMAKTTEDKSKISVTKNNDHVMIGGHFLRNPTTWQLLETRTNNTQETV